MKIRRNLILNILLLMTVLFSSWIDDHSCSETKSYFLEQGSDYHNSENKLSHHFDISDEDQIDQSLNMLFLEITEGHQSGIISLPLPNKISSSVWQPPQRSWLSCKPNKFLHENFHLPQNFYVQDYSIQDGFYYYDFKKVKQINCSDYIKWYYPHQCKFI